ncbi:MAG TPA: hypothetical protein VFW41_12245 [Gaiellaceae bacterium]|nr:hypothetical protein [Gaiellaceae bacterium]
MRMLLGALALAASILHTSTRAGQVQTIYTSPAHRTIAAFAQDGALVAWFAPRPRADSKGCNEVWLWQLGSARQPLPAEGPKNHNVTCGWQVPAGSPVGLAVAGNGGAPALLWTLHESAAQALKFDYVLGATVADPRERRFQEVAHANHGAGLWLGGVAGSGGTLVYAVAQVAYRDQVACLSTPKEPGACDLKVTDGGIYRIVGRKAPIKIDGAKPAVMVAASSNDVAYVPASGAATADGRPLASAAVPVEVLDVDSGSRVASVSVQSTPVAIGLSTTVLAVLGRSAGRLVLDWFDVVTGKPLGSLKLPLGAAPTLSVSDSTIVFRVGRSIRAVAVHGKHVRAVARAAATPIGLSIAGDRVAWAENVAGRGRIRAVTLAP